jgi:pimeloyl-ACP methyl ester carboxylesterase
LSAAAASIATSDGVAPATDGASYANKFAGERTHRIVKGAGHDLPQEAPQAFVDAVLEVAGYAGAEPR